MVTYELFYTPETAKMHKENKLSDIDERIAKIEKLVGSSAGQALDDFVSSYMYIYIYFLVQLDSYILALKSCFIFSYQLII